MLPNDSRRDGRGRRRGGEGWMAVGREGEQQLTRAPGGAFESGVPGKASITVSPSASNPCQEAPARHTFRGFSPPQLIIVLDINGRNENSGLCWEAGCRPRDAGLIVRGSGSKLPLFDRSSYISNTHIHGDAFNTKPTPL